MSRGPVPTAIHRSDDAITITWDDDDVAVLPARDLRLACRCAACVEEMSGRPLLDPSAVTPDITPLAVELVGAYAIRIRWSDGHATGLYTYEYLRGLAEGRKGEQA